jgi:hypothetical protein
MPQSSSSSSSSPPPPPSAGRISEVTKQSSEKGAAQTCTVSGVIQRLEEKQKTNFKITGFTF